MDADPCRQEVAETLSNLVTRAAKDVTDGKACLLLEEVSQH